MFGAIMFAQSPFAGASLYLPPLPPGPIIGFILQPGVDQPFTAPGVDRPF